jgi:anti-sigma B factor antagonist
MIQIRNFHKMIDGLPVLAAPAEIGTATVGHLGADLLYLFNLGHRVVVVDMSRTRFCDSMGFEMLRGVHDRVRPDGSELRLVIPEDGAVRRVLIMTGTDDIIACFVSLTEALTHTPAGA